MSGAGPSGWSQRRKLGHKQLLKSDNMPETPDSPCVNVCQLDASKNYCTGCFRTLTEIGEWSKATAARKQDILTSSLERKKQSGF